jgi:hypothetical protein
MSKRSLHRLVDAKSPPPVEDAAASEGDVQHHTVASIKRFASDQAHHLGNRLIAVTFCLKHLRGHQRTKELEEMVEQGFRDAEQGLEAMRQYMQAMRVLQNREPN